LSKENRTKPTREFKSKFKKNKNKNHKMTRLLKKIINQNKGGNLIRPTATKIN